LRYPKFLGGGSEIFPWVFNVADVMLLAGMVLLLIHIHMLERARRRHEHAAKSVD
jgi:lipoprotein signal peptidase